MVDVMLKSLIKDVEKVIRKLEKLSVNYEDDFTLRDRRQMVLMISKLYTMLAMFIRVYGRKGK